MKRRLLIILVTGVLLAVGQLGVVPEASAHQIAASSGTWSLTGSLSIARGGQTATLLHNGKVLVAGGFDANYKALASAELYDPKTGAWSLTGSMSTARGNQTATLLRDGKVLVVGGDGNYGTLTSAELYNPRTGTWSPTGILSIYNILTATLLRNGNVLVLAVGVDDENMIAELYNSRTGTWSLAGSFPSGIYADTETLLANGNVLITNTDPSNGAELYNPCTGAWSPTGKMLTDYIWSTATLLRNGKVLHLGYEEFSVTTELYDPRTGTWSQTGDVTTPRRGGNATLLANGNVLLAGGSSDYYHSTPISNAEVYNPHTGKWSPTASMLIPRDGNTSTLLPNGKMLIAAGDTFEPGNILYGGIFPTSEAELYTPSR